jgi:hypothetical protein
MDELIEAARAHTKDFEERHRRRGSGGALGAPGRCGARIVDVPIAVAPEVPTLFIDRDSTQYRSFSTGAANRRPDRRHSRADNTQRRATHGRPGVVDARDHETRGDRTIHPL